jgi:8-oxo-dGTP pyrophosphatase MutT (NUDIX family)
MRRMEPREAATIVLARPAQDAVEVLILTRSEGASFLPGFAVFPGGAIDPGDHGLASRLFMNPSEAARACAVRELYEEAGILLTRNGAMSRAPEAPLESILFDPPPARRLVEIARWIAPEFIDVRFDARFFAVGAPQGIEAIPDDLEVTAARWLTPQTLLEAVGSGEEQVMWPTLVMLQALAACQEVADVLALRVEQIPHPDTAR